MKKIVQLLPLALVLALGDTGRAQLFGETFDGSWPYGDASFVTDNNPPWSSSDAWQNNGLLRYGSVPGGVGTNNVVGWIGGLAYAGAGAVDGPTTPLPASLDFQIYPGAGNPFYQATITVDQNLANASNVGAYTDDGKRDVFGWAVKDLSNQVIMSLKFVDGDYTRDGNNYDTAIYGYTGAWWGGGTETTIGNGAFEDVVGLFNRGEWTTLDIALNTLNGTWSATLSDIYGNDIYPFIVNAPTAPGTGFIGSLSALWEPTNTETFSAEIPEGSGNYYDVLTSAGKNSLLMDNIEVTATAIPEPSSTALLGCGIALWFGTRRRSKSA